MALALIAEAGVPVAAPSANRFGDISPTTAEQVRRGLGDELEHVLDGGPCRVGVESTIISLAGRTPVLLRAGGIPVEQIEQVVGPTAPADQAPDRPTAPGQYPRHYAPRTPLILCESGAEAPAPPRAGLLTLTPPAHPERYAAVETLSASGDLQEAAANLFAAMHRLDALDLDAIVATAAPETGLGRAINDRLRRAACPPTPPPSRREST
jgi:L-threonylcarbamoyladenylate synthase